MSIFSLTFLAPIALLGLLGLAVPVYLHLRHKPRSQVLKFSAIDFLLQAQKKRKRRYKFEQLLLMLARLLIIGLLAFLFARPFLDKESQLLSADSGRPLVILLDDSVSMLAGRSGNRFFEIARDEIGDLLADRSSGSAVRLLPASDPARFANQKTAGELKPFLAELRVSTGHHTLDEAYRSAMSLVKSEGWSAAVIQVFSDGSLTAWNHLPNEPVNEVEILYRNLRDELAQFTNFGITALRQPVESGAGSLEVTVRNSSDQFSEADLELLAGQGRLMRYALGLEAGKEGTHRFELGNIKSDTVAVRLPQDDFDLDNYAAMIPRRAQTIRVLIVDGDTNPVSTESEGFFLQSALEESTENQGFQVHLVTPAGLTEDAVKDSDVVCLLNVDVPDTNLLQHLLAQNKGIFIAMGNRMDMEAWLPFMSRQNLEMWEPKIFSEPQPITVKLESHPMYGELDRLQWESLFNGVGISGHRLVSIGRANVSVPFGLPDGSPLLFSLETEGGRLAVWTSSMDLAWTDFPLRFGFVPFCRQLVRYLAGHDLQTVYQSMTVSEVERAGLADKLSLKSPLPGFEGLPVQGIVPGIYGLQVKNQTQYIQVHFDPEELDFRALGDHAGSEAGAAKLEALGFRSHARADLGPRIQWLLFLLILIETGVAAHITQKWGAR